mmetsp:Transcript_17753/g.38846  ORF Transcript_17753/g.38846 Transcript_17753/m.38846 type:complete len:510 (+) Transcript_17753:1195-2724(+)
MRTLITRPLRPMGTRFISTPRWMYAVAWIDWWRRLPAFLRQAEGRGNTTTLITKTPIAEALTITVVSTTTMGSSLPRALVKVLSTPPTIFLRRKSNRTRLRWILGRLQTSSGRVPTRLGSSRKQMPRLILVQRHLRLPLQLVLVPLAILRRLRQIDTRKRISLLSGTTSLILCRLPGREQSLSSPVLLITGPSTVALRMLLLSSGERVAREVVPRAAGRSDPAVQVESPQKQRLPQRPISTTTTTNTMVHRALQRGKTNVHPSPPTHSNLIHLTRTSLPLMLAPILLTLPTGTRLALLQLPFPVIRCKRTLPPLPPPPPAKSARRAAAGERPRRTARTKTRGVRSCTLTMLASRTTRLMPSIRHASLITGNSTTLVVTDLPLMPLVPTMNQRSCSRDQVGRSTLVPLKNTSVPRLRRSKGSRRSRRKNGSRQKQPWRMASSLAVDQARRGRLLRLGLLPTWPSRFRFPRVSLPLLLTRMAPPLPRQPKLKLRLRTRQLCVRWRSTRPCD